MAEGSPTGDEKTGEAEGVRPKPELPGEPSRAAPSALSLDEVFRETMGRPARAGSSPESLDDFFSENQEGDGDEGEAESSGPPPSAAADLEAFNAWLEGLKK